MSNNIIKTHRCEKLLKHNKENFDKVRIRYGFRHSSSLPHEKEKKWYLDTIEEDWDYDVTYTKPICAIQYCIFCGENLS